MLTLKEINDNIKEHPAAGLYVGEHFSKIVTAAKKEHNKKTNDNPNRGVQILDGRSLDFVEVQSVKNGYEWAHSGNLCYFFNGENWSLVDLKLVVNLFNNLHDFFGEQTRRDSFRNSHALTFINARQKAEPKNPRGNNSQRPQAIPQPNIYNKLQKIRLQMPSIGAAEALKLESYKMTIDEKFTFYIDGEKIPVDMLNDFFLSLCKSKHQPLNVATIFEFINLLKS